MTPYHWDYRIPFVPDWAAYQEINPAARVLGANIRILCLRFRGAATRSNQTLGMRRFILPEHSETKDVKMLPLSLCYLN